MQPNEARVNITYGGKQGDLPDPVNFDSTDGDIKAFVTEAVRAGQVPGLDQDTGASFQDFVVDRFRAESGLATDNPASYNRISIRPKTPFGVK